MELAGDRRVGEGAEVSKRANSLRSLNEATGGLFSRAEWLRHVCRWTDGGTDDPRDVGVAVTVRFLSNG